MVFHKDWHKELCDDLQVGDTNASRSTVGDMRIVHRSFDIIMAQEFLDRSDIVTGFLTILILTLGDRMSRENQEAETIDSN